MRAFIACDISHPGIQGVIEEFKKTKADIKFVEPDNTHITLKFLGEVDEKTAGSVGEAIEATCARSQPMQARLSGVGVFPSLNYIKVLWIGVICPELVGFQCKLDDSLNEFGMKREKNFKTHLTIGRVRSAENKQRLTEVVDRLRESEIGTIEIESVKLKKSELTPKGPKYSDLKVVKL
jgi:2'-5' RNA ligase